VTLPTTVPSLDHLLDLPSFGVSSDGTPHDHVRFTFSAQHSHVARVVVDMTPGEPHRPSQLGVATSVTLEVTRHADAFTFALEGRVEEPTRGDERANPFTVHVTAHLSFSTMALAGSRLWWMGGARRWQRPDEDQSGPLARVLTLDRAGGTPYFGGVLDLGGAQRAHTPATWVKALVSEHTLRLTPQPVLRRHAGFVEGTHHGPDLVFHNLGTAAWQEMLAISDEARLDQSGAGIGYVQGVTGRDVGDEGPHIQPIATVHVRLLRTEQGLHVTFDGELGEIQQTPSRPPLGPQFHGDFMIPTAFLFARGILLRDQWAERQRRLQMPPA
jgi:hypothetical protein